MDIIISFDYLTVEFLFRAGEKIGNPVAQWASTFQFLVARSKILVKACKVYALTTTSFTR